MEVSPALTLTDVEEIELGEAATDLPTVYSDIATRAKPGLPVMDVVVSCMGALLGAVPLGTYSRLTRLGEEGPERTRESKVKIAFIGMAGFCVMGKPITRNPDNAEYLRSRWRAYCATAGLQNTDQLDASTRTILEEFQNGIANSMVIKRKWVEALLTRTQMRNQGIRDPILLTLNGYGMKSYMLMDAFISVPSLALAIRQVNDQAVAFRSAWENPKRAHGDNYTYAAVLGADLSSLHHRNYPDLYYCALHRAVENGDVGKAGNFKISDMQTAISKKTLEKLSRPLKGDITIQAATAVELLKRLGHAVNEGVLEKRRREFSDDEDEEEEELRRRIKRR